MVTIGKGFGSSERDQNWFQSQLSGKSSPTRFWIRKLKGLRALVPLEPKMIPDEVLRKMKGFRACAQIGLLSSEIV